MTVRSFQWSDERDFKLFEMRQIWKSSWEVIAAEFSYKYGFNVTTVALIERFESEEHERLIKHAMKSYLADMKGDAEMNTREEVRQEISNYIRNRMNVLRGLNKTNKKGNDKVGIDVALGELNSVDEWINSLKLPTVKHR